MGTGQQSRSLPVLLVEDNFDTQDALKSLLELKGYRVVTAFDGREALSILRQGLKPGLILLDLMMPGMDGFQFINEKRDDPRIAAIPVIIYSGHHDAEANAVRLGANAYFQKPIDVDNLLKLIAVHARQPSA
jgi:CheY-like chemotaxis protein